ncbi:MAG: tetratricopeptide repeat protein [Bacteroidota bacterium]
MLKKVLVSIFLLTAISGWSQDSVGKKDSTQPSDSKTIGFESYYYDALNEKIKGNYREAVELLRLALRFKPNNADAQYEISINYKSLKDYRKAILFGENAVLFSSENKWYRLNVAELYSLVGDNNNAERCYGELAKIEPKFIPEYIRSIARTGETGLALEKVDIFLKAGETEELLIIKRDLLVVEKKNDEAIELTEKLLEDNPSNAEFYYDISELLMQDGQVNEAGKFIEKGLLLLPENPLLVRQNFKILMRQSKFDEAFFILEEAFENPEMNFNEKLGFVVDFVDNDTEHKQTSKLISALESWVGETNELKIYPIIANLYKIEDNKPKALEAFKKGFEGGYTEFSSLIEMLILEQELGRFDLLLTDSDKMLELFPSHPVLYLFKGYAANQLKNYDYSIEVLDQGLDFVVNNDKLKGDFYSIKADNYYQLNKVEKAFDEYDKAVAVDPENIVLLNNYSFFLAESGVDLDKALEMIKQVVGSDSKNSTYLDTMAWIYYKKGEYEQARKILKEAINYGGDSNAEILEHYGDILYKLDKVNLAVKQWEKAYEIASSSDVLKDKINNRALIDED